jgi:hypothetical protein
MTKHEMKKLMNRVMHHNGLHVVNDRLLRRQVDARVIAMNATNGEIHVVTWQRDCDHRSGTSISTIPASVMAYEKFCDRAYMHREGPMAFRILSREQAEGFEIEIYDCAAEVLGGHYDPRTD